MIKTVESLESHGAEYIDTGIAVVPGRKIVVDFEFTQIINDTWVAGASNNPIRIGYFAGTFNNQLYTGNFARYSPNELGVGIRVIATMEVAYDISRTLYLFGRNWDNVANGFAYCKIYSAKIYEGSNIIADFVPFVNTETDVCGMYDRVSDTYFYNQGGGNFIAHVGWEIIDGQITNENFIPMPELYDTQPDVLWRIDSNTNLGFPYNKLMIGLVGIDLWALDREHVIRIYDMHEPQDGFDGNGLAVLNPTVCTSLHNDERWDVELRHPLDDWGKWKNLLANNILKVDGQLFRIDISEPAIGESGREMYVHAKHITCDMADMLITFATFPGGDAARFMDFCFSSVFPADLPGYEYYSFEGYSDIHTVLGPDELVNTTVWAAMVGADNCLKNRYGGELYRDNFYFSINQRMQYAKDNAFCLRYSLDMVKIQQRVDYSDVCTNLECYDNFGNYWAVATITPTFALHHPIVRMVQFNYSEFEGAMERLAADGMAYWQTVNTPKVTYEAQIASLRRDPRYKDFVGLQNYNYGDSGTIYCPELDISTTQRITEVEKDELTGDITRMLLGNLRESLSRPTYMGSTISSGRSIEDKQNRANQNAIMSQSISGMEQFAISALELRTIDQLEGQ